MDSCKVSAETGTFKFAAGAEKAVFKIIGINLFFFGKSNTGNLEKLTEYGSYYSEFFAVTGILL